MLRVRRPALAESIIHAEDCLGIAEEIGRAQHRFRDQRSFPRTRRRGRGNHSVDRRRQGRAEVEIFALLSLFIRYTPVRRNGKTACGSLPFGSPEPLAVYVRFLCISSLFLVRKLSSATRKPFKIT